MITERKKDAMAIKSDRARERYTMIVNEEGKKMYPPEEEYALLRKLLRVIAEKDPSIAETKEYIEFMKYNEYFEKAKEEARKRTNIT